MADSTELTAPTLAIIKPMMADVVEKAEGEMLTCLAGASHVLGRRLRGELELCSLFGLGRWQMRTVLDRLVQSGVVTRRRGSGTFVKRIPKAPARSEVSGRITLDQLLAAGDLPEPMSDMNRNQAHRRLELALWSDWAPSNRSLQAVLAGMVEHANRCGHTLTAQSMLLPSGESRTVEQVLEAVNASRCHGAIFGYNFYADHAEAFIACQKPVALYYPGAMPVMEKPSVCVDMESAVSRAVQEFAGQGYKKVALLGLSTPYHDASVERLAFEEEAKRQSLRVAGFFPCDYLDPTSCQQAVHALLRSDADAVFIADDVVLSMVSETLRGSKSRVGRDLGIITLANRGVRLPDWCAWSKMQLDGWLLGRTIIDVLAMHLESVDGRCPQIKVRLNWQPHASHLRSGVAAQADVARR